MTTGLKVSQKRKEKLFAKKIKLPTAQNIEKFKNYNKVYCKTRRAAKRLHYNNQFIKFSKDSKKTWSLIRDIVGSNKSKEQLPTYFQQNGKNVSDYLEIANGFNTFFSDIGPKLASEIGATNKSFQTFMPEGNPNSFKFSRISEIDILRICREMKPKISSGADFISTKLLKEIAPLIITPLLLSISHWKLVLYQKR